MRGFWSKLKALLFPPNPWKYVDEGYDAWYEGALEDENPYREGSICHTDWEYGWTEADDEDQVSHHFVNHN